MQLPDLARSLTLIGSTPGDGELPIWSDKFAAVATKPPGPSVEERVDYLVRELPGDLRRPLRRGGSPLRAERIVARGWSVDAVRRSVRAANHVLRTAATGTIWPRSPFPPWWSTAPADRVLTVDHGRELAEAIPCSEYLELKGMGHEVQSHYVPPNLERLLPLLAKGDLNRR